MQFYFNRNKNNGNFTKENKKFFRIMRRPSDLYDIQEDNDSNSLINEKKIIEYARKYPEKTNIQIFKELGYPVPEGSQINNERMYPEMFYEKNEIGELVPKKNIFCKKNNDQKNENLQKSFCSIINSPNLDDSLLYSKKSPIKNKNRTSQKKLKESNLNISRKSAIFITRKEENETKLFKCCMNYYCNILKDFSEQKKSIFNSIQSIGEIYFLLKFSTFDYEVNYSSKNSSIIKIFPKKQSKEFLNSVLKLLNWAKNNNEVSEKYFLYRDLSLTQLAKDFSQNLNLLSKRSDDDIIMKSIREENEINDDVIMESIKNEKSQEKKNKISLDEYDILLMLKAKRIKGQVNRQLNELLSIMKKTYYYENKNNNNKKEEKKYVFRFEFGTARLAPVEIINNEKKSNISDGDFKKIMDSVKIGETIILAFAYNPIHYFDINNGKYKGDSSDCQKIYFIDCSKNNQKLNDVFAQIDYNIDDE